MEKIIHYCWFGPKPLPKLAKKCIKSWEKYLPDYKIIKWSEDNVDLFENQFIKSAYE
ncbi:MAG: capsular polysaccharide synthesis protein, partial [Bacilli bacterium]